jgi:hypothetical protein
MWSWRERVHSGPERARWVAAGAGLGAVLVVAVLLAVGVPAGGQGSVRPPRSAPPRAFATSGAHGDLLVTVSVTPDRPGLNVFTVEAASSRRPAPGPVAGVALRLGPDVNRPAVQLTEVEPGRYVGTGRLDRAGAVAAAVVVRRVGGSVSVPLSWSVPVEAAAAGAGAVRPTPAAGGSRVPFGVVLPPLLGAFLLGGARLLSGRRRRGRRGASAAVPAPPRALEGVS